MSRFCIVESFSLSCIPEATERLINEKVCLRCAFSDLTTRKKIVKETETFIRDFPCYCLRVNWMWLSMKNRAWCIFQNMKCVSWLKALHQLGSESLGSTSKWLKIWAVCRKDWASSDVGSSEELDCQSQHITAVSLVQMRPQSGRQWWVWTFSL